MHIHKSLSSLGGELERARQELRIVEEQILFQMDVAEEERTRMLVAETPLAERNYRIARDDLERMHKERQRVSQDIERLRTEQDRLLDRMLG
jgi:chromosome segregation ATPase